jgi:uncharacterized protein (DUF1330 family)
MSAYVIVNIDVQDAELYEEYRAKVPAFIQKYGGEYLARGGNLVVMEGDWMPRRLVLFRFPDMASAQAMLDDPEYQPLKALRQRAARTQMVAVEGVP